ncbi:hypothetical protein D5086_016925 [Populus alba]|uniref:Uncharacterized protein n=3 Tax=Populus TaxID=3689 RepID=A0ACC4BVC6_POPAL|nr:50S ribosomal protein L28 [Populus alba x Populus x berolinensis]TKR83820.1 50S ribosomal protein L28, chloroplastic [Populus alba]
MEGDSDGENKPASDATEEEPCQPGQGGGGGCSRPEEVCVENKSTAGEDFNLEKVGENKVMAEEKLNLAEVSGDVEKTHLNDSMRTGPNSIEKDDGRICPFTGKKANRASKVSFSNHKTKKLQFVNLQYKRVWWEAGKRYVKLRLSTKALKTIEKNGLDAVAKKAGIDLRKE